MRKGTVSTIGVAVISLMTTGTAWAMTAKSTIVLIADGMGHTQKQTASYLIGKALEMDGMPVAGAMNNNSSDEICTDSAAAATALATGYKTKNGMLGVTPDSKPKASILEVARDAKKSTGLVATSTISHATPAGFGSHVKGRGDESEITAQYLDENIDLLLGGGMGYFIPKADGGFRGDKLDLVTAFRQKGYSFVKDSSELASLNALPGLGLFALDSMAPELDREVTSEPSLADMTAKAIDLLSKDPDGFFLMVEGSQVDWGCHDNDPAYAMNDLLAFDKAVAVARNYAHAHPDTLVVVCADHETGGMTLVKGDASWAKLRQISKQNATAKFIASALAGEKDADKFKEAFLGYTGVNLKASEVKSLMSSKDMKPVIAKLLSSRDGVVWATGDHSGAPVPVLAEGAGQELFSGWYDNTLLPVKVASAMGLNMGIKVK